MPPGLFELLDTAGAMASVTFPARVQLLQVRAVMLMSGEFPILLPSFTADGAPLQATNASNSSQIYTFTVEPNAPPISTLGINVADCPVLFVSVIYKRPDVRMPILPSAPGFYALKVTLGSRSLDRRFETSRLFHRLRRVDLGVCLCRSGVSDWV